MAPQVRHQIIYNDLLRRLQIGEWSIGEKFPTPKQLLETYKFSYCTIFKAIRQLTSEGYLSVKKGIGTYVERTAPSQKVGILMNEACLRPQQTPFAYVLNQKIISILEKKRLPYVQYIERKGDEFAGQFAIENLATSLQQHSLRGLIMANCNFDQVMNECPDWRNYKVPYVTISTCGDSDFKIVFDAPHLFRTAFQYFEERGRNNVAIICSTPELPMVREIISSFQGLHSRPEWLIPLSVGPKPEHKGFELMSRLWQGKNHPDALFVADDIATKGVVQAAISMGVKIPKELLILHGANSNTDVFYPIEMPKIEYDLDEIAKKAFELLNYSMSNFNSKSKGVSKMIRARLLDVHSKR